MFERAGDLSAGRFHHSEPVRGPESKNLQFKLDAVNCASSYLVLVFDLKQKTYWTKDKMRAVSKLGGESMKSLLLISP